MLKSSARRLTVDCVVDWIGSVLICVGFDQYYARSSCIYRLAEKIRTGAESVEGVKATLWKVPDKQMIDWPKGSFKTEMDIDIPVIKPDELPKADGFIFGFPSRFGMMAPQFKAFLDATGCLWKTQELAGKPAGIFCSTHHQGCGQETSALSAITQLVHHGMLFVPIGYNFRPGMFEMKQVKGGTPYGAASYSFEEPTFLELEQAFHQGNYIATITKKLKGYAI
ncbi:NAD(P)H dehydrogenase (quinone) FQR1-like [Arachis hypogaea]|uniref:NAD(P)H dehydrogenase (quinone) FQR1-like n=1 Tax=Arachis hypogaea TaxID=3818 RepID=UPI000DECF423|nr:NAD(P)H dehydrogenase (quinone) FQR1-like [Arachis hypogaea]